VTNGLYKWTVDADHPGGYLVPLTSAEQTQLDTDQQTFQAIAAQQATFAASLATIQQNIASRLAQIRTARAALADGTIFASLSANEKAVIDGLLVDDIYLGRIALELFDGTT
jgi:hypothetical protein